MRLVYNDTSHSYWLDGTRVKSASKVAQIAADSFTIEQWQKRQVAIGMTLDRTLIERVAVDLDNREAIQLVCEDALNAAKANDRARRGTQRHRVFELGLLGRQDQFVTDQQVADWKVLERTLDAYGLEPIPDRVEQFVAWPDNGVVGRYDAYLYHHACGMPVLVDLKGGINAVKYPHSTAVQMWLYRNAPHTSARVVKDGDKSTVEQWTTHPDHAALEYGYVLHCDDHHDIGELWRIDLTGAEQGGKLALGIVDWRKANNYGKALAEQCAVPPAEGQPGVEGPANSPTLTSDGQAPGSGSSRDRPAPPSDRRAALLARYNAMSQIEQDEYRALNIDKTDLDAIEAGLDQVDRFNRVTQPPPAPTLRVVPPPPEPPDEGGPVDETDIKLLHERFDRLPDLAKLWTGKLVAEGKHSFDWRIKEHPTVRRYELYRGVLALAEAGENWANDDTVSDLLDGIAPAQCETVGQMLGCMDALEAAEFAERVDFYLTPHSVA